jgi:hypothetical protein
LLLFLCRNPHAGIGTESYWLIVMEMIARTWLGLIVLDWWLITLVLMRLTTACGAIKIAVAAIVLPIFGTILIFGGIVLGICGVAVWAMIWRSRVFL